MDDLVARIIKEKIANCSGGLIRKSYIKSLREWTTYYTFEYKGTFFKRLFCKHKYKCVYLASKNDEKRVVKSDGTIEWQPKRIVGEYEFECTSCGKRLNVHMDYWYQIGHDDIIN